MAKVNEKEVKKLMESLDITREEAIELLDFDSGDVDNEEVDKIEQKAKEEEPKKTTKKKGSSLDKVKNQKAKKKVDATKDSILKEIKTMVDNNKELFINPQELTSTKITFMDKDGNFYSISLTKHKTKPDGYSEES